MEHHTYATPMPGLELVRETNKTRADGHKQDGEDVAIESIRILPELWPPATTSIHSRSCESSRAAAL